jgi:hypothetical protein
MFCVRKQILGVMIAAVVLCGASGVANPSTPTTSDATLLPRLLAASEGEREKIAKQYAQGVAADTGEVIAWLKRDPEFLKRKVGKQSVEMNAIRLLGDLRREEATGLLFDAIEVYDDSFPIASDEWTAQFPLFPCAIALTKIGAPAIPHLLKAIQEGDETTLRFQLSCLVLRSVLGEQVALAAVKTLEDQGAFRNSAKEAAAIKLVKSNPNQWSALNCKDFQRTSTRPNPPTP